MNPELITRLVSLVEKTGDRVVLADPATGKAVVVMDLASYEKLSTGAIQPAVQAPAAAEAKAVEPAPEPALKITVKNTKKTAQPAAISVAKEQPALAAVEAPVQAASADLTQEELLDKINREIAAWKTAQEKKRSDELKAAARNIAPIQAAVAFEEEERFYLEPIE